MKQILMLALAILAMVALVVGVWVAIGKRKHKPLTPLPPQKNVQKKAEVRAVIPELVEPKKAPTPPKPESRVTQKSMAVPRQPKRDSTQSMLARLYRAPPKKKEDLDALRKLDEEVSKEAKDRLKGKKR
jgi:hypothetical protein